MFGAIPRQMKVREMTFNHWTQRFEGIDRARISSMDWFEESAHAIGTGFWLWFWFRFLFRQIPFDSGSYSRRTKRLPAGPQVCTAVRVASSLFLFRPASGLPFQPVSGKDIKPEPVIFVFNVL